MWRGGRHRSEPHQAGEAGSRRRGAFVGEPCGAQGLHHRRRQVLEQPRSAPGRGPALAPSIAAAPALGLVRAAATLRLAALWVVQALFERLRARRVLDALLADGLECDGVLLVLEGREEVLGRLAIFVDRDKLLPMFC